MSDEDEKRTTEVCNELAVLPVSSKGGDEIYCTQDWYDMEKLKSCYRFVMEAKNRGLIENGVFTLEKQQSLHELLYPNGSAYEPISVALFTRQNSKGEEVQCYLARNGHHRMWVMRHLGVLPEALVCEDIKIGSVGPVRSMEELNRALKSHTENRIGVENTIVHRNRPQQRSVSSMLVSLEA